VKIRRQAADRSPGSVKGDTDMAQQQTGTSRSILVVGAGVIGSTYAAWLSQADQQVTILARGQRLAELRNQGLRGLLSTFGAAGTSCKW